MAIYKTRLFDHWARKQGFDHAREEALKKLAAHLLSLTAQAVTKAKQAGELIEVDGDAQDEISHS